MQESGKTGERRDGTWTPLGILAGLCVLALSQYNLPAAQAQAPDAKSLDPTSVQGSGATPNQTVPRQGEKPYGFHEPGPVDFADHSGYTRIFDGVSLTNWVGDPSLWRVQDGAIVGESTKERPVGNSYISFHGFEAKDFDLKLEIKVERGGGSGIQYRSQTGLPWHPQHPMDRQPNLAWMMTGPQADFWFPVAPAQAEWTGQFYSENTSLGILAWRGQVVESAVDQKPTLLGDIADRSALGGYIKVNDWNEYLIVARGGTFLHIINGKLMAVYLDDDVSSSNNKTGLIGIELEGVPSKVSVRNVWIKRLR